MKLMNTSKRKLTTNEIEAISETPLTSGDFKRMRRVPAVAVMRRSFMLTQEDFAARFHIPLGTLRDWEQGRSEPDAPAKAYLKVIRADPEGVAKALAVRLSA
jgi:putative transcriptional regulator